MLLKIQTNQNILRTVFEQYGSSTEFTKFVMFTCHNNHRFIYTPNCIINQISPIHEGGKRAEDIHNMDFIILSRVLIN